MGNNTLVTARLNEISGLMDKGTPHAEIKRICALTWEVDKRTIERDISYIENNRTRNNNKDRNFPARRGTVKTIAESLIRMMLTGEGKTKSLRTVKVKNGLQDMLCYPSYADSLNADDRFLKLVHSLSRKAAGDSLLSNAMALFERWLRRARRHKNVANSVLRHAEMSH